MNLYFLFIFVEIDFVTQNSVGCNLSWSQFIDTINRKCEQISRENKQKLEPQCLSIDQEAAQTSKKTNKRCQSILRYNIWYHTSKILCYKNIRLCEKYRNEILYLLFSISWHTSRHKHSIFFTFLIQR